MSKWSTSCGRWGGGARDGGPGLFEDPKSFYVVEGINLD